MCEYFRWKQGIPLWHKAGEWEIGLARATEYLMRTWGKAGKRVKAKKQAIPTIEETKPTTETVPDHSAQICAESTETIVPDAKPKETEDFEEDEYEEDEIDLSAFYPSAHHAATVTRLEQLRQVLEGHDENGDPVE